MIVHRDPHTRHALAVAQHALAPRRQGATTLAPRAERVVIAVHGEVRATLDGEVRVLAPGETLRVEVAHHLALGNAGDDWALAAVAAAPGDDIEVTVSDDVTAAALGAPSAVVYAGRPRYVYHLAVATEWPAPLDDTAYKPAAFAREGFVHCSDGEDALCASGNRYLQGLRDGPVIVRIDLACVRAPVRWERGPTGRLFPHIYGPIEPSAVAGHIVAPRSGSGRYLPFEWAAGWHPHQVLAAEATRTDPRPGGR